MSEIKKNINRCDFCNKKVGMLGLLCKCQKIFCRKHSFFRDHNCSYNYRNDYDSNKLNLGGGTFEKLEKI